MAEQVEPREPSCDKEDDTEELQKRVTITAVFQIIYGIIILTAAIVWVVYVATLSLLTLFGISFSVNIISAICSLIAGRKFTKRWLVVMATTQLAAIAVTLATEAILVYLWIGSEYNSGGTSFITLLGRLLLITTQTLLNMAMVKDAFHMLSFFKDVPEENEILDDPHVFYTADGVLVMDEEWTDEDGSGPEDVKEVSKSKRQLTLSIRDESKASTKSSTDTKQADDEEVQTMRSASSEDRPATKSAEASFTPTTIKDQSSDNTQAV